MKLKDTQGKDIILKVTIQNKKVGNKKHQSNGRRLSSNVD